MAAADFLPTSATTTTSSSSSNKKGVHVRWDQVFMHEFPILLGDNPGVSKGAPLTIDWKPVSHDVMDVDIFEYFRAPERKHRRKLVMSSQKRAKL